MELIKKGAAENPEESRHKLKHTAMKTETILKAIDHLKEKEGLEKALETLNKCNTVMIAHDTRLPEIVLLTEGEDNSNFKTGSVPKEVMANLVEETRRYFERMKAHLESAINKTKFKIEDLKD